MLVMEGTSKNPSVSFFSFSSFLLFPRARFSPQPHFGFRDSAVVNCLVNPTSVLLRLAQRRRRPTFAFPLLSPRYVVTSFSLIPLRNDNFILVASGLATYNEVVTFNDGFQNRILFAI